MDGQVETVSQPPETESTDQAPDAASKKLLDQIPAGDNEASGPEPIRDFPGNEVAYQPPEGQVQPLGKHISDQIPPGKEDEASGNELAHQSAREKQFPESEFTYQPPEDQKNQPSSKEISDQILPEEDGG